MGSEGIKPMASLGSALLGKRAPVRRAPLTFAPIEEIAANTDGSTDLPEVVLQVARLAQALGIEAPGEIVAAQDQADGPVRARVAFTLRLDGERHRRLRQIAAAERRSAQQVLTEAFDRYSAGAPGTATSSVTLPSPCPALTGNQP